MAIKIQVVLIELALSLLIPCPTICSNTIEFLLMIPNTGSTGIIPAVNQVLDEINRKDSLLPDHRLDYMLREIEVCMLSCTHASVLCCSAYRAYLNFPLFSSKVQRFILGRDPKGITMHAKNKTIWWTNNTILVQVSS